jgi:cation transport ATPase
VPTRAEELADILEQRSEIEERRDGLRAEILLKSRDLRRLGIVAEATRDRSHLRELHEVQTGRIAELSTEVEGLRDELTTDEVLSEALDDHANRLRNGERPPANAHIARAARPLPESEARTGRVAQLWASISVAVVLLMLTGILVYQRQHLLFALVLAIAVFAFIEAGFRKRINRFMVSVSIGLSVVGAFVLFDRFFWQIIVLSVLTLGLYILWENLRELGR